MPPYSERVADPFDTKPLSEELSRQQRGLPEGDTPSPRTPSTSSSISPPPLQLSDQTALIPIYTEDGIPHDYTLPHFIRQVSGEPTFDDIQNLTLRVLTETSSLQQMSLYTPNLRELNLEGSSLSSLRDIGCELRQLEVLRIGHCRLHSLNGTLGLQNLRELYASRNFVTNAAPCAHLSQLRVLDLSRNLISDIRSLGFLSPCKHLTSIRLENNPISSNSDLQNYLQAALPRLQTLDEVILISPRIGDENGAVSSPLIFERRESLPTESASTSSGVGRIVGQFANQINNNDDYLTQPGPSTLSSISRLTSGQVLCGNITINRQKFSAEQKKEHNIKVNIRRWRNAINKVREQLRAKKSQIERI